MNKRLKSRYTLVLPIFLLTVHLLSQSALQMQLSIMHTSRKAATVKIYPETWNTRFLNRSLQSPLLHNCSRTEVTWRLLGVEQSDAVQSVTRLRMPRHYRLLLSAYCSSLLLVAHTQWSYFCRVGWGGRQATKRKERKEGCSGRVNHWIYL